MEKLGTREIDESRQGEALVLPKPGHSKQTVLPGELRLSDELSDEIVASIPPAIAGYSTTRVLEETDLILLNTCAIPRQCRAARGVTAGYFAAAKNKPDQIVSVLSCMAERLKTQLLEQRTEAGRHRHGPDAYRDLPNLIAAAGSGQKAVNVLLSREETYAEISPVRLGSNGITAFISIMRGLRQHVFVLRGTLLPAVLRTQPRSGIHH